MKVSTVPLLLLGLLYVTSVQAQRVIHVVVPLCDNEHQGIVPVPGFLGNGLDTERNLYWGAAYGIRTWFNKSPSWKRVKVIKAPTDGILERIVWKHTTSNAYLVADAYDGRYIEGATTDLLRYAAGHQELLLKLDTLELRAGGAADLLAYCGHDGLMEFSPPSPLPAKNTTRRQVIILACMSKTYFGPPLRSTGAEPLLWTTNFMAPESYTLDAALEGWLKNEEASAIRNRAASAYAKWQKCSMKAAQGLLVTGW